MVCAGQSPGWKVAVGRWVAWPLIFFALICAGPPPPNSALAQETSRKLKSGPPPEYPVLAHKLNIQGSARVRFTITRDGKVRDVKEVGGNPVLLRALVEAVKNWKYESAAAENDGDVLFDFRSSLVTLRRPGALPPP